MILVKLQALSQRKVLRVQAKRRENAALRLQRRRVKEQCITYIPA
jgi:hypothetical protein